jgi:hypothetical protein
MKDTNGSVDWRVLCELASKENDPKKLLDLITKINQALEEFHQKSRHPLNANAYPDSIAPYSRFTEGEARPAGVPALVSKFEDMSALAGIARHVVYATTPDHLFAA